MATAAAGLFGVLTLGAPASVAASQSYSYSFPAPPIAVAGSIPPGGSVSFALRVTSNGTPASGAVVYLGYLNQYAHPAGDNTALPTSQCNAASFDPSTTQSISYRQCVTDNNGQVLLTYTTPALPPAANVATDFIAKSSSSGSQVAITHYVYSTVYRFSPSPIAAAGSLAPAASVVTTVTAADGLNRAISGSTVLLSFTQASGGGTAFVGSTQLTGTPALFLTDSTGSIHITYTAPAHPPTAGIDAIHAQDRTNVYGVETATDSYDFAAGAPVISIGDATVMEGDEMPGIPAKYTVTISAPQPNPVTVQYRTICGIGDKTCSEDYKESNYNPSVTATIPANATSTTLIIRLYSYIGANEGENYNEGWFVQLFTPSTGTLGRAVGNGILLPDQESGGTAFSTLSVGDTGLVPTQASSGVKVWFSVTLGTQMSQPVTFTYATADGTALAGTDYNAASGTVSIGPGKTSAVISVLLRPASTPTTSKRFTLTISNATGGATIYRATGTGTVLSG